MNFNPPYVSYDKRIRTNLSKILLVVIFYLVIFVFFFRENFEVAIMLLIFSILTSVINFKTDSRYLKSIHFTDEHIEIKFVDKDTEQDTERLAISDVRILIWKKTSLLFNSFFGRNYSLRISGYNEKKCKVEFEQFEAHKWKLNIFNEILRTYQTKKGLNMNIDDYKKDNF